MLNIELVGTILKIVVWQGLDTVAKEHKKEILWSLEEEEALFLP